VLALGVMSAIWLGLGTLAFDLLLVLTVTSLLRTRIGFHWWKALHWSRYACWVTALVHALGTGSDVRTSTFLFLAGICCAAAVGRRLAESVCDDLLPLARRTVADCPALALVLEPVRRPLQG
jgi:DMSO/TMAO reductase YedYZ heme-binding membrane subunit